MDRLFRQILRDRTQISVRYDAKTEAIWAYGNPRNCPCLDLEMFEDFYSVQLAIIDYFKAHDMKPKIPIRFFVYASQVPGVYGYGGELLGMIRIMERKDRESLERCAKIVNDTVYLNLINLGLPIQTITLLEGDALGGGLHAALSYNAIIAEEQVKVGMQQIRFNMCPGVGAYALLAHRIGTANADKVVLRSEQISASEFYAMGGLVDVAKEGEGKKAVDRYIKQYRRSFHAMQTLHAVRMRHAPLEYSELEDLAALWVDAMLGLEEADIARIKKIAESQRQKLYNIPQRLRTKQDRRFMEWDGQTPIEDSDGNILHEDRRINPDRRA